MPWTPRVLVKGGLHFVDFVTLAEVFGDAYPNATAGSAPGRCSARSERPEPRSRLPAGFGFHDLRHYYASLLIASGADEDRSDPDAPRLGQGHVGHLLALVAGL